MPTELLSAALRHLRDAEHLASQGPERSLDQAYHLAGFAPECARKAALPRATFDKAIGHGLKGSSELAFQIALALDPGAHRYDISEWAARLPKFAAWSEECRYDTTGTRNETEVHELLSEVRPVVEALAYTLWADGMVSEAFAW
jgi:hypothetical protein